MIHPHTFGVVTLLLTLQAHTLSYAKDLSTARWFTDANDPFHRAPAFLNSDTRPTQRGVVDGLILQDQKAWVAGLSDECGAAPAVGMAMSVLRHPQPAYVQQLEQYVHGTLWGNDSDRTAHRTVQFDNYGCVRGRLRRACVAASIQTRCLHYA